jgi:hypothetical protein
MNEYAVLPARVASSINEDEVLGFGGYFSFSDLNI